MSFRKLLFVFGLVSGTCPPSGWVTEQDGSCTPDFSDDTEVVCSSDRFSAKISLDQVYWNGIAILTSDDQLNAAKIIINSNENCEATYDTDENLFIITDQKYDDCGITAVVDGSKFTLTIPITANEEGRTANTIKITQVSISLILIYRYLRYIFIIFLDPVIFRHMRVLKQRFSFNILYQ